MKAYIENHYGNGVVSCDFSPKHGFLGVHANENFRKGKAETLLKLVREGHEIISVGDSLSDYVPFSLPNRVVFVQDGLPKDILSQPHVSVSGKKGISGVTETLKCIAQQSKLSAKIGLFYDI